MALTAFMLFLAFASFLYFFHIGYIWPDKVERSCAITVDEEFVGVIIDNHELKVPRENFDQCYSPYLSTVIDSEPHWIDLVGAFSEEGELGDETEQLFISISGWRDPRTRLIDPVSEESQMRILQGEFSRVIGQEFVSKNNLERVRSRSADDSIIEIDSNSDDASIIVGFFTGEKLDNYLFCRKNETVGLETFNCMSGTKYIENHFSYRHRFTNLSTDNFSSAQIYANEIVEKIRTRYFIRLF